jgi:seryl-tRNA synthetase
MAGSGARFDATGSEELMRMALGHELKGLLLNYALASRQRAELASAKEKGEIVEKNLAILEDDVKAAKERCEGDLKSLKEKHAEEVASLKKKHEGELSDAKRDKESAIKTMNVVQASMNSKDERIKALTQENETALAELKVLREEKAKWGSEKENLEVLAGEQYDEGFSFALDQVKILFPDLDPATLSQADTMSAIESGKLIPYVPAQKAPESSAKESPENVEEPLARSSPANE